MLICLHSYPGVHMASRLGVGHLLSFLMKSILESPNTEPPNSFPLNPASRSLCQQAHSADQLRVPEPSEFITFVTLAGMSDDYYQFGDRKMETLRVRYLAQDHITRTVCPQSS